MPTVPSEADVIFNRASVALAKSQRLIASWLPPKTPEELASAKSEEELESEEKAIFAPVPELLGVGAPVPKDISDGNFKRRELSSNDKLLKQLLGTKAAKAHLNSRQPSKHAAPTQKPTGRPVKGLPHQEDSENEGEGRSSMFKSKRKNLRKAAPEIAQDERKDSEEEMSLKTSDLKNSAETPKDERSVTSRKRTRGADDEEQWDNIDGSSKGMSAKKPSSMLKGGQEKKHANYLDEILSERKNKKKKKKVRET